MQKNFDDFKSELQTNEACLQQMNKTASRLMSSGRTEAALEIQTQIEEVNQKRQDVQQSTVEKATQLVSAKEIKEFEKDVDDITISIHEHHKYFNSDFCRDDFHHFQKLQKKYEGLERDLASLGDRIRKLYFTASRLMQVHPEAAESILKRQSDIEEKWTQLNTKTYTKRENKCNFYYLPGPLDQYQEGF